MAAVIKDTIHSAPTAPQGGGSRRSPAPSKHAMPLADTRQRKNPPAVGTAQHNKELERMNALLKKQRAQLVAINKAKDEFISIASHQLRTPASAVKQYIGLLMQGYVGELTDMQRKMVNAAFESNQRQLNVIDDLLRVAQVDTGKITLMKQECDIVKLVGDIVCEQRSKFEHQAQTLRYLHPDNPVMAAVDQRLLRMVIENLIDNASKYSPKGKATTVSLKKGTYIITLQVKDQGIGMGAQDKKRLFQKFSRLTSPLTALVSGSGLGLYWAKKIIALHHGTIDVTSREGRGSTFTVTLPLG